MASPRALLTRPQEDNASLAKLLRNRNIDSIGAPILDIRWLTPPRAAASLDRVQALLFTSANGVRAFARNFDQWNISRDIKVFAVGDGTARTALELGFTSVQSAEGDVSSLAKLVAGACRTEDGALFHVKASITAGDLSKLLESQGFKVIQKILYEAKTAEVLPPVAARELAAGKISMALFFSPRTAAGFVRLLKKAGLENACGSVVAYALSANVAEKLKAIAWKDIHVAPTPDLEALLATVDDVLSAQTGKD